MFRRLIILFALLTQISAATRAADWPQFRGPERDNKSMEAGLLKSWPAAGPKVAWTAPLGTGFSSMAVAGGRVFTMYQDSAGQYLVAFDEKTGSPLWKVLAGKFYKDDRGFFGPRSTPTVEGDLVYALDGTGDLVCVKAASGESVWKKNIFELVGAKSLGCGSTWSPFISGEMILFNAGGDKGGSFVALSKKTGDVIWKCGEDKPSYSTPAPFKDGFVFVTGTALNGVSKDGKVLWQFPWKTQYDNNDATPVVNGDRILVSAGYGHGAAVVHPEGSTVKKIWEDKRFFDIKFGTSPILVDGCLYGPTEPAKFECVDFSTGQLKWAIDIPAKCQQTWADGLFYLLCENGTLALVKATPEKGEIVSSFKALPGMNRWSLPVVANGKLFVRDDKKLLCLNVKE